jgi:hypothetical protein
MRLFCTQRHVAMTHFKPAVVRALMRVLHTYTPQGEAAKASSRRRRTLSSVLVCSVCYATSWSFGGARCGCARMMYCFFKQGRCCCGSGLIIQRERDVCAADGNNSCWSCTEMQWRFPIKIACKSHRRKRNSQITREWETPASAVFCVSCRTWISQENKDVKKLSWAERIQSQF